MVRSFFFLAVMSWLLSRFDVFKMDDFYATYPLFTLLMVLSLGDQSAVIREDLNEIRGRLRRLEPEGRPRDY